MRLAVQIAIVALAAALLAGCGSSGGSGSGGSAATSGSSSGGSVSTGAAPAPSTGGASAPAGATARECETQAADAEALRATGVGCEQARHLMFAWQRAAGCAPTAGASGKGCTVRSYRCLATVTGKGVAVSCAEPGRSIAFTVRRG